MQERKEVTDYLSIVKQRLQADGFKITENVTYKNQTFICVAKRTRWQLEHGGFAEFFFVFAEFPHINKESLQEFSARAFNYSKKFRSIPLPRGLFEGVNCFPVAIVYNVDQVVSETVCSEVPPKHWAAFEMPVIYDLKYKRLYYLEKTPYWGSLYWDHFREMIVTMLSP
jgi:hypothetical protein